MKEQKVAKRNSSIELLRLVCIAMVIIQHLCEQSMLGGLPIIKASGDKIAYALMCFMYSCSRVAVNVFILISGYFSFDSDKRPIGKAINLLVLVSGYAGLMYLIRVAFNVKVFDVFSFLGTLFPKNYYVTLFIALYFISPYINVLLRNLSSHGFKKLITILVFLFSFWSTVINSLIQGFDLSWTGCFTVFLDGTGRGFSIVNFVMLYIIGAYIKSGYYKPKSRIYYWAVSILAAVSTTTIRLVIPRVSEAVLNYDSIFVVLQSVTVFCLFLNFNAGFNKYINEFAKRVFGIFLLHFTVIKALGIVLNMNKWFQGGVFKCALFTLIVIVLGMIISGCIDWIVHFVFKPISEKWKDSKLYSLDFTLGINKD